MGSIYGPGICYITAYKIIKQVFNRFEKKEYCFIEDTEITHFFLTKKRIFRKFVFPVMLFCHEDKEKKRHDYFKYFSDLKSRQSFLEVAECDDF